MKNKYHSYNIGTLPKGCRLCVQGKKSVLFVTGLCSARCYFCPISEKKKGRDVTYINEWRTSRFDEIVKEINLCGSAGVGITGGDPLVTLSRTTSYIRKLKKMFGKGFHIHLYTPLNNVTGSSLRRLHGAGLDEIRFHPNLDHKRFWLKIALAKAFRWKIGVEIPAIPKKEEQAKDLIRFVSGKVDFLNINELEYSDTNEKSLTALGYHVKDSLSYGIEGSEKLALRLLGFAQSRVRSVHYCTATLKDRVQLAKRIGRRAKNVKKPFDMVTKDSTILRGAIYHESLMPGFGYRKKLEKLTEKKKLSLLRELAKIRKSIMHDFSIPKDMISLDKAKLRLLTGIDIIIQIRDQIDEMILADTMPGNLNRRRPDIFLAAVEEYPTHDATEISVEFL